MTGKFTRGLRDIAGKLLGEEDCALCGQSLWRTISMEIPKHYDFPPNDMNLREIKGKYTVCDDCCKDKNALAETDRLFEAEIGDYFNGTKKFADTKHEGK